jgi:hypothetical protein
MICRLDSQQTVPTWSVGKIVSRRGPFQCILEFARKHKSCCESRNIQLTYATVSQKNHTFHYKKPIAYCPLGKLLLSILTKISNTLMQSVGKRRSSRAVGKYSRKCCWKKTIGLKLQFQNRYKKIVSAVHSNPHCILKAMRYKRNLTWVIHPKLTEHRAEISWHSKLHEHM